MKPGDISRREREQIALHPPLSLSQSRAHTCRTSVALPFPQQKSCSCTPLLLRQQAQSQDIQM
jgi:hypothetical protein